MQRITRVVLVFFGTSGLLTTPAFAQQSDKSTQRSVRSRRTRDSNSSPLALASSDDAREPLQDPDPQPAGTRTTDSTITTTTETEHVSAKSNEDPVTERQSVDAFNSIEDGQPGAPGEVELQFDLGWETTSHTHDPFTLHSEIKYTPDGSDFLRNMKLELSAPVDLGLGGVDGNADLIFGWKQRWVEEHDWIPTLSTLAEVRIPSGYHSSGVDGTLTGIVAKDAGLGTIFLNTWIETVNGNNIEDARHFQWGVRAGYKWRITDDLALIGDYIHQCSEEEGNGNLNALELSGMYTVNEHIRFGPGILIGLDDNGETPNFGAGVRLQFSF